MTRRKWTTVKLKQTAGFSIDWNMNDEGVLEINSTLSEEETKAILPQIFPAWLFELGEAAQERYDRKLRDRDRAIERWRTLAETAQHNEANLREAVRRKQVKDSIIRELRCKLAELKKALQEESHTEALLKGRLEEFLRMKNERPIDPTYWDTHEENGIRAALASLRAESKEPVD